MVYKIIKSSLTITIAKVERNRFVWSQNQAFYKVGKSELGKIQYKMYFRKSNYNVYMYLLTSATKQESTSQTFLTMYLHLFMRIPGCIHTLYTVLAHAVFMEN